MAELLADHTTLRVGGPAAEFVTVTDEAALVEQVRSADAAGIPVLVLGGGSNLLVADAGFDGRVVAVRTDSLAVDVDTCSGALVRVSAGYEWDALVEQAVTKGWVGVEALAGIPGSVGATPIQNVGAYGQEVAQTVARVRCWDRRERTPKTFAAADCGFGYRTSRFKAEPGRYVVLEVTFQFRLADLSAPVGYAELAQTLGVEPGQRAPVAAVRRAVLDLRARKGMVLDPGDHDTWSVGSFFTNPVIDPAQLPPGAPAWPQPSGRVKTSAAWLIEQSGFTPGFGNENAAVSGKHTLALTNRGAATATELVALARTIRDGVLARFGIEMVTEPVLVGCSL
ncbi:MAG: UDP-N-acetylmuramate dehydrogenase [Actinomycetota bacterium]|nr:UDP-N-acetylmuramate dehydrogenase [Actinomycetota bacterium]